MYFLRTAKPLIFDFLATIVFATVLFLFNNIFLATAIGIAIGIGQFALQKIKNRPIGPLQYLSVALVVVFGVTTLVTHNPHFIMLKPTIIDLAVGTVMATRNWMAPYLPPIVTSHVSERTIARAGAMWAALLLVLAVANAVVAFLVSPKVWALYATFVPQMLLISLFCVQYLVFRSLIRRRMRESLAAEAA